MGFCPVVGIIGDETARFVLAGKVVWGSVYPILKRFLVLQNHIIWTLSKLPLVSNKVNIF